jgi:hypothetical protein
MLLRSKLVDVGFHRLGLLAHRLLSFNDAVGLLGFGLYQADGANQLRSNHSVYVG